MSGYRIVLNLTGNASTKVTKLANDLVRADLAAGSLARSLGRVSAASHSIAPIRTNNVHGGTAVGRSVGQPNYTRHRSNRILSYGVGGNIGGFSGRLSTIIQPDANGNILGVNASQLMKSASIIALSYKAILNAAKVVAGATLAPMIVGGGSLMIAMRALQSEKFSEGVRLISRERQAKLGLGTEYARGQANADFLAQSYGFDRSTTLSSINVLTGMGVGGTGRKLNVSEATGLTKVGGLIAQQSGVSFERVMTNIQQLLVQVNPNVRDIREMLNQAPILGKYALKDMEEKGVKGVDVRTWLKDQNNIMSAFKRFEFDLASNAGMQARGQIGVAQLDFWKQVAGNDKFWRFIGMQGASTIGAGGASLDKLMTTLASNTSFKVMVTEVEMMFNALSDSADTLTKKFTRLIDVVGQILGVGGEYKGKAREKVGRVSAIEGLVADPTFRSDMLIAADKAGMFTGLSGSLRKQKEDLFVSEAASNLMQNKDFLATINGVNKFDRAVTPVEAWRNLGGLKGAMLNVGAWQTGATLGKYVASNVGVASSNRDKLRKTIFDIPADSIYRRVAPYNINDKIRFPNEEFAAYDVNKNAAMLLINEYIKNAASTNNIPTNVSGGGEAAGTDLTGFNRDRRALEIHFNAPIVEWNNTMEATSPQETVDAVAENIEQIASAAIQKALLGASNKMSTRWY